jgi:hypothetical protein
MDRGGRSGLVEGLVELLRFCPVKGFHTPKRSKELPRDLELIREGTRAGSLPNCGHFMRELAVSRRTVMRDRVEAEEGALAAQFLQPGVGDFIEGVELVSEVSMRNAEHPTSNIERPGRATESRR